MPFMMENTKLLSQNIFKILLPLFWDRVRKWGKSEQADTCNCTLKIEDLLYLFFKSQINIIAQIQSKVNK